MASKKDPEAAAAAPKEGDAPKAEKAPKEMSAAAKEQKAKGEKKKKGGNDTGFAIATAEDLKKNKSKGTPRLKNFYTKEVVANLQKEFKLTNPMQVPRLKKIVINMGLGEAVRDPKILEGALADLAKIAGQRPVLTMAKKSIATYKLREGMPIGCMVTLRRERMWEFLDRLVNVALPRVRDFRGVATKLDGRGSYSLGLKEQIIFTEIDYERVDKLRGMNITFVTSSANDDQAKSLLQHLGMPFRK
jgi:large subunit ribosomal protein L5